MRSLLFLPIVLALFIISCSKDKETDASSIPEEFYGEFAYELLGDPVEEIPDQLFTAIFSRKTGDAGAKGEFTINGKVIRFEEEFLGYQWDDENEVILDTIIWIDDTDPKWEEFDTLPDVEFEIVAEGIIFINDENEDGVISDEERVLYKRRSSHDVYSIMVIRSIYTL